MRLTFDLQSAARNQLFIVARELGIGPIQNKSGHVAVAAFTKSVLLNFAIP